MDESDAGKNRIADRHSTGGELTRRAVALRAGGGLALAGLALGLGRPIVAQEATPGPTDDAELVDRYGVIRVRKLKADRSAEELTVLVQEGFVPLLREVPGFVSYAILWNAETRDWAAISLFADRAGAAESNARAAAWGAESGAIDFTEGDPLVVEGTVVVAAGA
jgi:hypothetical protein